MNPLCSCVGGCRLPEIARREGDGFPACRVKRGTPLATQEQADQDLAAAFDGPPGARLPLGGRPTEVVSGGALLPSVYGALSQLGVPPAAAGVAAAAIAFLPLLVSALVDGWLRAHG